jgi:hypothetical protein
MFKLDKSGHVTVLHSFTDSDLAYSYGGLLVDKARNLYGTTFWGVFEVRRHDGNPHH